MILDTARREISAGDYIIYTISAGRSAVLKYGKVIGYEDDSTLLVVTVRGSFNYAAGTYFAIQNKGRPVRIQSGWHVLLVPVEALPKEVQELLNVT